MCTQPRVLSPNSRWPFKRLARILSPATMLASALRLRGKLQDCAAKGALYQ